MTVRYSDALEFEDEARPFQDTEEIRLVPGWG